MSTIRQSMSFPVPASPKRREPSSSRTNFSRSRHLVPGVAISPEACIIGGNESQNMKPRIGNFSVERFRSFSRLKIDGLGMVNLITGRNNTGKSSLLEALRIFASDASPRVISEILWYREENFGEPDEDSGAGAEERPSQISSLFSGFPSLEKIREPIIIASNGLKPPPQLSLSVGWFSVQREPDGSRRLVEAQSQIFSEADRIAALVIETPSGRRVVALDSLKRHMPRRPFLESWIEEPRIPCVYVSPYGSEHTAAFGPLWDKIALSDREHDIIEALRIITDDITAVSMVGGESRSQSRMAIVKLRGQSRPRPLRSFGDGLNRLFGIILSLVTAKGGLLLIDEIENGIHHSIQSDVWRTIFRLSKLLHIQVFATSHSWDCVEAFQKAASEDPEAGVLIRLSRKGDEVIPTLFRETELAVATRERIEVR